MNKLFEEFNAKGFIILRDFISDESFSSVCKDLKEEVLVEFGSNSIINIKFGEYSLYLEKRNIQTRVVFTGNILRQPIMKKRNYKKVKDAEINSNKVMKNGILIACHHGLTNTDLNFMKKTNNFQKKLIA